MELRSCTDLHFIKAVRGGLLLNVMNVYQGNPALKFKTIIDIYENEDAQRLDSLPITKQKDEFEVLPSQCDKLTVERSCMPMVERRTIKNAAESSKFSYNGGDDERNSSLDDLIFGRITLQQIKDGCKDKKRKRSSSSYLSEESVKTSPRVKKEYSELQAEEEEYDLNESLSSLKAKLSKKSKIKRKRTKNCPTMLSQCGLSMVRSPHIPRDQDLLLYSRNMSAHLNIKVEAPEPGYTDCQDMNCVAADSRNCTEQVDCCGVSIEVLKMANECSLETNVPNSSTRYLESCSVNEVSFEYVELADPNMICVGRAAASGCNEQVEFKGVVSSEVLETGNECVSQTGVSISSTKEPQSCVNEASPDHFELSDPKIIVGSESSFGCDEHVDYCGMVSSVVLTTTNKCVLDMSTEEYQSCVLNEASYEDLEVSDPKFDPNSRALGWEVMEVNNPETVSSLYSDFPVSDSKDEGYVNHPPPHDVYPDTVTPIKDCCSDVHDKHHPYSYVLEISLQKNSNTLVQVPNMALDNSLQCMEHRDGCDAHIFKDGCIDDLPSNPEAIALSSSLSDCSSSWDSDPCSSPRSNLISDANESPTVDATRNCSTGVYNGDAIDDLTASSVIGNHHHLELQHPPERLFSTRKDISPTSQERLCKALEFPELHYEEHYERRRKLLFGTNFKNNISRAEGLNDISAAEVTFNPKQILKKPKNNKKAFHPKSSLNVPLHSPTVQCVSTGCNSIQNCSQSAITFTQRQMNDIECLTTKLTKQLKYMKDIVIGNFPSEMHPATSLKYSADEVKMAIEDTTKIEKSAKRWMSIMTRDCNRFCKIMKLTEKGPVTSGSADRKERKKISFADEAGGKLCDVKIFKDNIASLPETNNEKQDLLVE